MLVVCMGMKLYGSFNNTQYVKKMGFIEKFLNTHTMHQVHHAQNIEYMKNHGGILNVFDRILGLGNS
jgi:sterol desaturase/sphingolipid hydroxylase (fatty acid hydroxylase superfamily)